MSAVRPTSVTFVCVMGIIFGALGCLCIVVGFAWQVASLASIFLSYVIALNFRGQLAQAIQLQPPLNIFAAHALALLTFGADEPQNRHLLARELPAAQGVFERHPAFVVKRIEELQ